MNAYVHGVLVDDNGVVTVAVFPAVTAQRDNNEDKHSVDVGDVKFMISQMLFYTEQK